ncbi:hypothetical protein FM103_19905 [Corynebacterium xerosis]|nr:hypothetical protein FM103_19905 [Corynebacterium xerosis]
MQSIQHRSRLLVVVTRCGARRAPHGGASSRAAVRTESLPRHIPAGGRFIRYVVPCLPACGVKGSARRSGPAPLPCGRSATSGSRGHLPIAPGPRPRVDCPRTHGRGSCSAPDRAQEADDARTPAPSAGSAHGPLSRCTLPTPSDPGSGASGRRSTSRTPSRSWGADHRWGSSASSAAC